MCPCRRSRWRWPWPVVVTFGRYLFVCLSSRTQIVWVIYTRYDKRFMLRRLLSLRLSFLHLYELTVDELRRVLILHKEIRFYQNNLPQCIFSREGVSQHSFTRSVVLGPYLFKETLRRWQREENRFRGVVVLSSVLDRPINKLLYTRFSEKETFDTRLRGR